MLVFWLFCIKEALYEKIRLLFPVDCGKLSQIKRFTVFSGDMLPALRQTAEAPVCGSIRKHCQKP